MLLSIPDPLFIVMLGALKGSLITHKLLLTWGFVDHLACVCFYGLEKVQHCLYIVTKVLLPDRCKSDIHLVSRTKL